MKYIKTKFIFNIILFTIYINLFCLLKPAFAKNESIISDQNNYKPNDPIGTVVPGGNVSGVFNLTGSPYYINGDITIPDQQTLTIDAGVEVIFNGSYKLIVDGRLLAYGNDNDSVIFKPLNSSTKWCGIRFDGILAANDSSKLKYCKITGAQATDGSPGITTLDNGGGLFIKNTNKISITNCEITENIADNQGGGVYIYNSNIIMRSNLITNNTATNDGGGIYATQTSKGYIQSNKIENNTSANAGGIMLDGCNGLIFNNNLISYNFATLKAGGIYFANGCNGKYANNTISRNKCNGLGDGLYISSSNPNIYNTIIYYNEEGSGANVYINNDGAVPNFYYSNIQNGAASFAGPGGWTYTGIYQNNVDYIPGFWGWSSDYFNINFMSPCVNRGSTDTIGLSLPKTDIIGNLRCYNNARIDIGAYEFQAAQNFNNISGNLSGVITTAGAPYFVAGNITVPEGQTLILEKGIQLYFLGNFSITVRGTLIAIGDESEDIIFSSLDTMDFHKTNLINGAWNRIIVESTSTNTVFKYCKFEFSKAVKTTDIYPQTGGAVVVNGSSPKFYNCTFNFNVALKGGGLAVLNTTKTLVENCNFKDCMTLSNGKGAALYIENASPTIFGSLFTSNSGCDKNNNLVLLKKHKTDNLEGVVYVTNSEAIFTNNTITENHAFKGGAFYINEESAISLKNNLKFYNNIIWANTASIPSNGNQFYFDSPTDSVFFIKNDITGGSNAFAIEGNLPFNGIYQNNIDADPVFTYS